MANNRVYSFFNENNGTTAGNNTTWTNWGNYDYSYLFKSYFDGIETKSQEELIKECEARGGHKIHPTTLLCGHCHKKFGV